MAYYIYNMFICLTLSRRSRDNELVVLCTTISPRSLSRRSSLSRNADEISNGRPRFIALSLVSLSRWLHIIFNAFARLPWRARATRQDSKVNKSRASLARVQEELHKQARPELRVWTGYQLLVLLITDVHNATLRVRKDPSRRMRVGVYFIEIFTRATISSSSDLGSYRGRKIGSAHWWRRVEKRQEEKNIRDMRTDCLDIRTSAYRAPRAQSMTGLLVALIAKCILNRFPSFESLH